MSFRSAVALRPTPVLEATSILLASTLALYLGVIYVFSFSMDTPYSRYAINLAIPIMDLGDRLATGATVCWRTWRGAARHAVAFPAGPSSCGLCPVPVRHRAPRRLRTRAIPIQAGRAHRLVGGHQGLAAVFPTPVRSGRRAGRPAALAVKEHAVVPARCGRRRSHLGRPGSACPLPRVQPNAFFIHDGRRVSGVLRAVRAGLVPRGADSWSAR